MQCIGAIICCERYRLLTAWQSESGPGNSVGNPPHDAAKISPEAIYLYTTRMLCHAGPIYENTDLNAPFGALLRFEGTL